MHQNLLPNNNDAQSTTKYGFLLWLNAHIVALHAQCACTALKAPPYAVLRSCSPRAPHALSRRRCYVSCRLGLPLWLFPLPPRHPGLLLQAPALRAVLLHPSQVMPGQRGKYPVKK